MSTVYITQCADRMDLSGSYRPLKAFADKNTAILYIKELIDEDGGIYFSEEEKEEMEELIKDIVGDYYENIPLEVLIEKAIGYDAKILATEEAYYHIFELKLEV